MADYIYTLETRLTPDQQKAVTLVQDAAKAAEMNLYLTGGAIRDIITGFPIRDIDFTVQGNALKLQKELERAGAVVGDADDETKSLLLTLPGNVRAEIAMARSERYEKTGKPPQITPATIIEDLRRRDFTVNAMALSLNEGSRGLLMDPFNGAADIEAKLVRVLHNYGFIEDPSRLIRATRFAARFHWPLEERTQQRYNAAKENGYIEYIRNAAIGHEIEQLAYEDDPLSILKAYEKEGWLKVLNAHWSSAKVDTVGLSALMKTRQQMNELGYTPEVAPAVLYFLTSRLGDKDVSDIRKAIPRKDLVEAWKDLEDNAKELSKRLSGKEAATPSRTWQLLSSARPEMILFLAVTARQQAVVQKIKNFFTKWRQVQQKIPLPEMTELHITAQLPQYPKIANDVFLMLLDGKLRSRTETLKYLKPLAPPPPPPPPPPPAKRGRGAKAAVAPAPAPTGAKGKGKAVAVTAPVALAQASAKVKGKPAAPAAPAPPKPEAATKLTAAEKGKQGKAPAQKNPYKPAKPAVKTKSKPKGKKKR
ncbi:MAG: CCA tRNA nucleotidyltransferase [Acidobacteriales bacterium]|nr:CCA tRNA nucleotidyltransferase [Candidatus Koribacter versatilis]MBI3647101.1 CCA tRNA nucleotidyltransferase [Terriglobales bacterium]